jgi:hypothetical protein
MREIRNLEERIEKRSENYSPTKLNSVNYATANISKKKEYPFWINATALLLDVVFVVVMISLLRLAMSGKLM